VTSFTSDMPYGYNMVKTFLEIQKMGDLLVCLEEKENSKSSLPKDKRIKVYDLNKSKYLKKWLRKNHNSIPKTYGGACSDKLNPWNQKASLWFRKIASLNRSYYRHGDQYDVIIWIDADCVWKKNIDVDLLETAFNQTGAFYHYGPRQHCKDPITRQIGSGIESYIMGFRGEGFKYLERVFDCYDSGDFLKYPRWDDGYIFAMMLPEKIKSNVTDTGNDLALNVRSKWARDRPSKCCLFRENLAHLKGNRKYD